MQTSEITIPDVPPAWAAWEYMPAIAIILSTLGIAFLIFLGWWVIRTANKEAMREEAQKRHHEELMRNAELAVRRREIAAQAIRNEPLLYQEICRLVAEFLAQRIHQNDSRSTWSVDGVSATINLSGWEYRGTFTSSKGSHFWSIASGQAGAVTPPKKGDNIGQYEYTHMILDKYHLIRDAHDKVVDVIETYREELAYADIIVLDRGTATMKHAYEAMLAIISRADPEEN